MEGKMNKERNLKLVSPPYPHFSPPLICFLTYFYPDVFKYFSAPGTAPPPPLHSGPPPRSHLPLPPHFSGGQLQFVLCSPLFLLCSSPTLVLLSSPEELTRPARIQTSLIDPVTPLTPLQPCCLSSTSHFSFFMFHLRCENFKQVSLEGLVCLAF